MSDLTIQTTEVVLPEMKYNSKQVAIMNSIIALLLCSIMHSFYHVRPSVAKVCYLAVVKRLDRSARSKRIIVQVWHHYHREADVQVSVLGSLKRCNFGYLDLVLIYWPMSVSVQSVDEKIDYLETWRGLENVLEKGLTKSIGVSNFNVKQVKRLLCHCKVPPVGNQIEVKIPTFKMNNGNEMPALGYGTFLGMNEKLEFYYEDITKMEETLSYAIDIGYRHIDTAHFYRIEPEVGQVINKKIQDGVAKREDLFVTTKVWHHNHREADVEVSVRASLKRSNLEYFDLVLIHWPMSISVEGVDEKIDYLETWRGFENVLEKGLTKSIGVSNFNVEQMKRLLANCKVPPVCNQIEINLNFGQNELVEFCQSHNIIPVAYSPFGTMIPSRNLPDSPEPKLNNPTMLALGKKYGKTVTQITLRYLYQRGIVSLPKTITKSRVLENASIFDFELTKEDMKTVAAFDNGYRTIRPVFWQDFQNYPLERVDMSGISIPLAIRVWKNGRNQDID